MKYTDVKTGQISQTINVLRTMCGDMEPLRIELTPESAANTFGNIGTIEIMTVTFGAPVVFVEKLPCGFARIVLADDVPAEEEPKPKPKTKKSKKASKE